MTILFFISLFLFLLLCIILCFVILIQQAKSLGLGASFGGDSGDSLFGTSTAEVLKKFTKTVAGIFIISCLLLSILSSSLGRNSSTSTDSLTPISAPVEDEPEF